MSYNPKYIVNGGEVYALTPMQWEHVVKLLARGVLPIEALANIKSVSGVEFKDLDTMTHESIQQWAKARLKDYWGH